MKKIRIYKRELAMYLTNEGFHYFYTVQDIKNPNYVNWIFEDTAELRTAIETYKNRNQ